MGVNRSADRLALALVAGIAFLSGSLGFLFGRMSAAYTVSPAAIEARARAQAQASGKSSAQARPPAKEPAKDRQESDSGRAAAKAPKPEREAAKAAPAAPPVVLLNPGKTEKSGNDGKAANRGVDENRTVQAPASETDAGTREGSETAEIGSNRDARDSSGRDEAPGTRASALDREEPAGPDGARYGGLEASNQADAETLGLCANRYRSFRRSDGTYQPYDGGPRRLCQYLH